MIYLTGALCCSALIAIAMRFGEGRIKNNISVLAVNYSICLLLSVIYTITDSAPDAAISTAASAFIVHSAEGSKTLLMGMVNGFFYVASLVLYQYNIRKNGVTLPATFMKLGVLVPTLLAITAFGERPDMMQTAGIMLAVAAILLLNLKSKVSNTEPKLSRVGNLTREQIKNSEGGGYDDSLSGESDTVTAPKALIALLLIGGSGDSMSKIYEELGSSELNSHFLLYTFFSAIILCTLTAVMKRQRLTRGDVLFGCLIGIPNYYSARFLLLSLSYVPAVIAYPTYSTGTIILVSTAGVLLFREKMTERQRIAVLMILAALILLNL